MANEKNLKPFKKGHKFSKGHGRPKGSRSISTVLKEMMEVTISTKQGDKLTVELIVMGIIKKAISGDVSAFREIRDTTEGRPHQTIKSGNLVDFSNVNLASLSDDQIDKLVEDNVED